LRTGTAAETSGRNVKAVLSESKNSVDEARKTLHNLVSLLLKRQTQEGGAGGWLKLQRDGPEGDAIFKN
jgi:hypothetical protein